MDPDVELTEVYGTVKEADPMALAMRIAKAILGMGLMEADRQHVKEHQEEADQLNDVARFQEAKRMEATINAMKMAEASGVVMAKHAFGAFIGKALGAAAGGATKLTGKLTPGWKGKAAIGAGTLAAGAGAYTGASKLRDYANTAPGNVRWGSKRPVKHGVSEWGYPTY